MEEGSIPPPASLCLLPPQTVAPLWAQYHMDLHLSGLEEAVWNLSTLSWTPGSEGAEETWVRTIAAAAAAAV